MLSAHVLGLTSCSRHPPGGAIFGCCCAIWWFLLLLFFFFRLFQCLNLCPCGWLSHLIQQAEQPQKPDNVGSCNPWSQTNKISHNFLIYSNCFNTSQKSFNLRFNEILLSFSFQGFFNCNFKKQSQNSESIWYWAFLVQASKWFQLQVDDPIISSFFLLIQIDYKKEQQQLQIQMRNFPTLVLYCSFATWKLDFLKLISSSSNNNNCRNDHPCQKLY